MTSGRYRAWRFLFPGVDASDELAGLNVTASGRIDMVDDDASVRQAIMLLLSTVPGERVMRPSYGCLLHRLIFSPNDDTTAGLAIHYVRTALERWEPRIDILGLDAGRNPDLDNQLDINLLYRVRPTQSLAQLAFPLDLSGQTR